MMVFCFSKCFSSFLFLSYICSDCTFWCSTRRKYMTCSGSGTGPRMAVCSSKSWVAPLYLQTSTALLTPSTCSSPPTFLPASRASLCIFQVRPPEAYLKPEKANQFFMQIKPWSRNCCHFILGMKWHRNSVLPPKHTLCAALQFLQCF